METKRVVWRKHSAELMAEVVQACRQHGASVAATALRNGLNANVVHRWLSQDGRTLDGGGGNRVAMTLGTGVDFLPVEFPILLCRIIRATPAWSYAEVAPVSR